MTAAGTSPGSLILRRARVCLMADAVAASALAIRDGRIVAVGRDADTWAAVGSDAPTVDLGGRVVLPGFTDAHVHWCTHALMQRELALDPSLSLSEVVRLVRSRAADREPGQWVLGRGWDHAEWGRWPTAADLDAVTAHHPVALTRKDGHAAWLNSAALLAAGIGAATPDPPGGQIERSGGVPSGILKENAIRLVAEAVPEPPPTERQAAMADAWPDAWCRGITACHDMGFRDTALFRDLATLRDAGDLGLRFTWYFPATCLDEAIGLGLSSGLGDEWLRLGGLKLYLDGTLGSHSADMLAPFEDQPHNRGIPTLDAETFTDLVHRAANAGLATAVHAIGDAAVRKALDGFAHLASVCDRSQRPLRHRLEHAQLVDPTDVPRLAPLGIVASMQPVHATSDMAVAERSWGARTAHAYAWRALLDAGARLAFGSDAPIEALDVLAGVHAAVTRQTADGEPVGGWHPEQALTVREAVAAYTLGAAHAGGQEDTLGDLAPGMYADLTVLEQDPFTVPPAELLAIRVRATMIEGVWVWQAPEVDFGGPRHTT